MRDTGGGQEVQEGDWDVVEVVVDEEHDGDGRKTRRMGS